MNRTHIFCGVVILLLLPIVYAVPRSIHSCSYESCTLTIPRHKIYQSQNDPNDIWIIFQNGRRTNLLKSNDEGQSWDAADTSGEYSMVVQNYMDYHASLAGDSDDNIYIADRCYVCESQSQVFFRKLNAPGELESDFEDPIYIDSQATGALQTPNILVQDPSTVFVVMRTSNLASGNIYVAHSSNGGASFNTPVQVIASGAADVRIGSLLIDGKAAIILHYVSQVGNPNIDYRYFIWDGIGGQFVEETDSIIVSGEATGYDRSFSMNYADGEMHLVYDDSSDLKHAWKTYNNGQPTWNHEVIEDFSYNPRDLHPSLTRHGDDLYLFYTFSASTDSFNNNVYYRKWNKTAQSWGPRIAITTDSDGHRFAHGPAIANPSSTFIPLIWNKASPTEVWFETLDVTAQPDTDPPIRSNGFPSGNLSNGTTMINISLNTNEPSTCRLSTNPNTAFSSMIITLVNYGGTSHTVNEPSLVGGQTYTYYVRCQDGSGNTNNNDYVISFYVNPTPPSASECDGIQHPNCVEIDSCQTLTQDNTYYILTKDVSTSDGQCFYFDTPGGVQDSILDLNGHTVYYANLTFEQVVNPGFEQGAGSQPTGWDLSGAPNTERYYGDYFLGDDYGPSLWAGNYSLKVNVPAAQDQVIVSSNTLTLEPGVRYVLSGYLFNLVSYYIRATDSEGVVLTGEAVDTSNNVLASFSQTGLCWRGFQFRSSDEFSVSETTEVYIRLRAENLALENLSGQNVGVYFDDVKLLGHNYYGLRGGFRLNWGSGNRNLTFKNGNVVQVREDCYDCEAVYFLPDYGEAADLTTWTMGVESSGILASTNYVYIHDNVVDGNVTTVVSRDNQFGMIEKRGSPAGSHGRAIRNTVLDSPQIGILFSGDNHTLAYNTVAYSSRYVQGFGIPGYSTNSRIHSNYINLSSGRGIHVTASGLEVYNNTIDVAEQRFQEHGTIYQSNTYGIQIEQGTDATIYDNYVVARSHENYGNAIGLRVTGDGSSNILYNNTFTALKEHDGREGYSMYFYGGYMNPVLMNNIFKSNDYLLRLRYASNFYIEGNTYEHIPGWPEASTIYLDSYAVNHTLHNPTKLGVDFKDFSGGSTNNSYRITYDTQVIVSDYDGNPLNAQLTIQDANQRSWFSGTIGVDGAHDITLREIEIENGSLTDYNPYNFTATYSGRTVSKSVVVNQTREIIINLSISSCSLTFDIEPCNEIDINEVAAAIAGWYADLINISELIEVLRIWKNG